MLSNFLIFDKSLKSLIKKENVGDKNMKNKYYLALALGFFFNLTSNGLAGSSGGQSSPSFELIPVTLGLIVAMGIMNHFRKKH